VPLKGAVKADGYNLCPSCQYCEGDKPLKSRKKSELKDMTDEVCKVLDDAFKMDFKRKIKTEIETRQALAQRAGRCVDGLYCGYNAGGDHLILLSDDLQSNINIRGVLAHELGHAWCKENGIPLVDGGKDPYCEGFASFVAWCYLKASEADYSKKDPVQLGMILPRLDLESTRIEQNSDRVYGIGFRKVKAVMGDVRTPSEWKKIMLKVFDKGICDYCYRLAETKSPGGERLCRECAKDTIRNSPEADAVLKDVRRVLSEQFKMATAHSLTCGTATRKSLDLTSDEDYPEFGRIKYDRNKQLYNIRIVTGLPRDVFRAAVAHQLAHDWMEENLPHLMNSPTVCEGFAEYVAWAFSEAEGSARMTGYIENTWDRVHGDGFRSMKKLLNDTGTADEWKTVLLGKYPASSSASSGKKSKNSKSTKQTGKSGR